MSGTNPPQQERSRKTLEQLLSAGARLLEERSFADVTVQEIVAEAGSSAGSFYARFDDKSAFLHALQAEMDEQMREQLERVKQFESSSVPIDDVCGFLATGIVGMYEEYRGVARALLTQATSEPELTKKAGDLLIAGSAAWADVVDAPGRSTKEILDELITAHLVGIAMMEQGLFYQGLARVSGDSTGMGKDGDVTRLARIMRSSMNL